MKKKCPRGAQPIARVLRPRSSPRTPQAASRTYPCAARRIHADNTQDDGLTRRRARKRSCRAHKQHSSAAVQQAMAASAPISRTDAPPMTVSVSSAAVPMELVAASMSASTLQAAVGDGVTRAAAGGCWRSACHRAGSARTATGEETSSTPCRRISLPMCSRLPLECEEPLFTVAVTEAAYLRATRQKSRKRSRASACTG